MVYLVIGLNEKITFSFNVEKHEGDSSCCSLLCVTSPGSPDIPQRILYFRIGPLP